jgi:hypothetical protein
VDAIEAAKGCPRGVSLAARVLKGLADGVLTPAVRAMPHFEAPMASRSNRDRLLAVRGRFAGTSPAVGDRIRMEIPCFERV